MAVRLYLFTLCTLLLLTFGACKKKKGAEPAPQEEGIAFTLENVAEGQYTASPGATYTFTVNVTSRMPAQGVTIAVTAVTDPGGIAVAQNPPLTSTAAATQVTLINLESLRTVKVRVTVTSVGQPGNTLFKEFWITNKS